jgi:sporulation protein YlmC with PRC-barrel domain
VSDSFRRARGRKAISRASAQELGSVSHLRIDAQRREIAAVVIGRGKKAQLVDWAQLSGFGPDAVMVGDEGALRPPANQRERVAADGTLELVGKRASPSKGTNSATLDDVTFDSDTGALEHLLFRKHEIPAGAMLGSGSYAPILDESQEA